MRLTTVFSFLIAAQEIAELESQGKLPEQETSGGGGNEGGEDENKQHSDVKDEQQEQQQQQDLPPPSKPMVPQHHLAPSAIDTSSQEWTSPFIQQSFSSTSK